MASKSIKSESLSVLGQVSALGIVSADKDLLSEVKHFQERLMDDEFRIAVVGEFSSGKSTFINAILGQDILQHGSTETTATITRIVNVPEDDEKSHTGVVILQNGERVQLKNLSSLREYTTTASEKYNVVNEVACVELYMPILKSDRKIILVDTPGLNGTADGHRDQTEELIKQAHACIYLFHRRGISESDVQLLKYLMGYQKNFIFVQNFIDEFKSEEGDSVESKLSAQKQVLAEHLCTEQQGVSYSICGISALQALAAEDKSIRTLYANDPNVLDDAMREKLYQESNFSAFKEILQTTFQAEALDRIQYRDTAAAICGWLKGLDARIEQKERNAREIYEMSKEHRAIEKLDARRGRILERKEKQKEYLKNFVGSEGEKRLEAETKMLEKALLGVNSDLAKEINSVPSIDRLEDWSQRLPEKLEYMLRATLNSHYERYRAEIQSMYQLLMSRIEEYSGISCAEINLADIAIQAEGKQEYHFEHESVVTEIMAKMEKQRNERKSLDAECGQLRSRQEESAANIRYLASKKEKASSDQKSEMSRLGNRPKEKERKEYYTVEVWRGGLGFLDWLLGPKEETRSKIVLDDSEGKKWDAQKSKIESTFEAQKDDLNRQINAAKRKAESLQGELNDIDNRKKKIAEKLSSLQTQLKNAQAVLEEEKHYAAAEYLASYKQSLCRQVEAYLVAPGTGVLAQIVKKMRDAFAVDKEKMRSWAVERFEGAVQEKLAGIDAVKNGKMPEVLLRANTLGQTRELVGQMQKKLEGIL